MFSAGGDAKKIAGAAGVFCLAGAIDPEQVRFESCAIRMDD